MSSKNIWRGLGVIAIAGIFVACSSSSTPASPTANDAGTGADGSGPTSTSGGSGGSATVTGTINGKTFVPVDAVALKGVYDQSYPGIVEIYIGNIPNLCSTFNKAVAYSHAEIAGFFDLAFTIGETSATSTVVPGTYSFGANPNEIDNADWDSYDSTCNATHDPGSSGATIVITAVGASYVGTFDVTFNNGDHVTGSFDAPLCDLSPTDAGTTDNDDGGSICIQ